MQPRFSPDPPGAGHSTSGPHGFPDRGALGPAGRQGEPSLLTARLEAEKLRLTRGEAPHLLTTNPKQRPRRHVPPTSEERRVHVLSPLPEWHGVLLPSPWAEVSAHWRLLLIPA